MGGSVVFPQRTNRHKSLAEAGFEPARPVTDTGF